MKSSEYLKELRTQSAAQLQEQLVAAKKELFILIHRLLSLHGKRFCTCMVICELQVLTLHERFLQTHRRADIDYGFAEADTTYGKVGVKVWIYKGEVLPKKAVEGSDK